ncbi:MAG: tRNA lysidine(34) synthetase TilS, partial [Chloroflexi bacterium]|nr:tRNA lysidine(34) synthetase TilS [Chloroflexota bacterium]
MAAGRSAHRAQALERKAERALIAAATPPGSVVVVAVSGGPDSMVLLHALMVLAPRLGLRLHVAHLDHGLRGAESAADAEYVARMAASWGVACTVGHADIGAERAASGSGWEAAARRVRYRFLAQVALDAGAADVAVAHTADDQAETVLLRMIRGAGTAGLAAMAPDAPLPFAPQPGLRVIRPLLRVRRSEVEAYCAEHDIVPRRDASNQSSAYLRNRVRAELVPLMATMNPNITAALNRLSAHAAADNALLEEMAGREWQAHAAVVGAGVRFSVAALRDLPLALRTRLIRRALTHIRGAPEGADLAEVDAVLGLLVGDHGSQRVSLRGGLEARRQYDTLLFTVANAGNCADPPLGDPLLLPVPGDTAAPGWRFAARLVTPDEPRETGAFAVRLDADAIGGELLVRSWRPGDRMQPLGMTGTRKLQDLFIDAKIPA